MPLLWKDFTLPVQEYKNPEHLKTHAASQLGVSADMISQVHIQKKSLDARKKGRLVYHFQLLLESKDETGLQKAFPFLEAVEKRQEKSPFLEFAAKNITLRHPPVIIGTGPAGMFAALGLQEAGVSSILVERGMAVEKRLRTVHQLQRNGIFNPESNFCFGEGGAGTFSDGKLTCGRNHPLIRHVFEQFITYGAPEDIAYEAHPHIGTDYLMRVCLNMRKSLEERGSRFLFEEIFTGFRSGGSAARYLVELKNGVTVPTDHLILAIGHSARDTYQKLYDLQVAMAPKPFAMGARIEHPQDIINQIQYGHCELGQAAEYKLTARAGERGIWTFCMCPGGHLLPTPAQEGHLAINGMSYHSRNSGFANAAVVVNVLREDFYKGHPLDGMWFQAALEQQAFKRGGGNYFAPAQRLNDFLAKRASKGEMTSTYKPGIVAERMDQVLPDFVSDALRVAMKSYNDKMRGYLTDKALIVGLESKTSSPVTLIRGKDFQSESHPGLYPCGEGAGYAGGIVSAALDGVRVAEGLLASY